jgi:hypothetical protein
MLEKRILSRLNAQYVYLSHATAKDIARDLYVRLILPPPPAVGRDAVSDVSDEGRLRFNKHIVSLFGKYADSDNSSKSDSVVSSGNLLADCEDLSLNDVSSPDKKGTSGDDFNASLPVKSGLSVLAAAINSFDKSGDLTSQRSADGEQSPTPSVRTTRSVARVDLASSSSQTSGAKRKHSTQTDLTSSHLDEKQSSKKSALQLKFEAEVAEAEMLAAAELASKDKDDFQYELLVPGSLLNTIRTRREWGQGIELV